MAVRDWTAQNTEENNKPIFPPLHRAPKAARLRPIQGKLIIPSIPCPLTYMVCLWWPSSLLLHKTKRSTSSGSFRAHPWPPNNPSPPTDPTVDLQRRGPCCISLPLKSFQYLLSGVSLASAPFGFSTCKPVLVLLPTWT